MFGSAALNTAFFFFYKNEVSGIEPFLPVKGSPAQTYDFVHCDARVFLTALILDVFHFYRNIFE